MPTIKDYVMEIRRRVAVKAAIPEPISAVAPILSAPGKVYGQITFGAHPSRPYLPGLEPRPNRVPLPGPNPFQTPDVPMFTNRLPIVGGIVTDHGTKLPGTIQKVVSHG